MSQRRKITTATLSMAVATGFSRIAGLVRDVVIARLFGAGFATDAFFMAFTIPNLLRRFFGEGSMTAAFVPVFADVYQHQGEEEARRLANRCITLLLLVMLIIVGAGIIASPWLVRVIGFGFSDVPGKLELTDQLNRIMFPYIGLVSLLALLTGILNVHGHFFLPSLSPLFLNLSMIVSALTLGHLFHQPIFGLAIGVLIGGVAQLLLQYPVLLKYRLRIRLNRTFLRDPHLRRIVLLMLPGIAGVAIYQINVVVSRLMASFLSEGSVSYLYYGQRLFEFPQGIFIVSLAQAALPAMSRQVADEDWTGLQESLRFALSLIAIFILPAIIGLILCAKPVYSLFFMGGEFDLVALHNTALTLVCFAPGLLFVGMSRIAAQTFYAMKDTRTPVWISFWTLLVNAGCGLLLMFPLQHFGLAIALTLASAFNALLLLWLLRRRVGPFFRGALFSPLLRSLPGSLVMAAVVYFMLGGVDWQQGGQMLEKALVLAAAVVLGGVCYLAICLVMRVEQIRQGWALICRRSKKGS
ncbi:MAG: murein biosynthesis integral membrane protein MurJ [Desulfuromonadales bacterium]|nr:murein biosynthesis integral membrane protein MurJ [Desulfuromonadales bacterium]